MYNGHADVTALIDTVGTVLMTYYYDVFGNVTDWMGSANNTILYAGYQYDAETGLYLLQSRYYDPQTGRFLNADSQFDEGVGVLGYNLFAYCANNPVNLFDPTGCNTIARRAGAAATFLALLMVVVTAGSSNFWNPVGWVLLVVAGVALVTFGAWSLASYLSDQSLRADLALISSASTAATPPPPNKGGKGTQTTSKTLYNKNGNRIDVENPGNRQGQIHLQQGNAKILL